jgi:hypothetical protein
MPAEISCQHVRKVFGKGPAAFEAVTAATFAIGVAVPARLAGDNGLRLRRFVREGSHAVV